MHDVWQEVLECCQGVCYTEEHDQGFEEAAVCDKHHFLFVAFFDLNIIKTPMDIHLCEVDGIH